MDPASPQFDRKAFDARIRGLAAENCWREIADEVARLEDTEVVLPATAGNAYKAYRALGDVESAERWLARALALAPANATLQRDQGVLHQKRGEWALATACFEAAVALRGDIASYRGNLATALFHEARYAEAAEQYRAGLALDRAQPLWWRRLARALLHLNEPAEAAHAYTRALELQDDAPTRSARDELLRQMRTGSRAASSAYYDAVFADSPRYAQSGEASEYAPAWQAIAQLLRTLGSPCILDLGCGPGQLAEFLAAQVPGIGYTGVDFSGVAVSRARQRCPDFLFEKRELPITQFAGLPAFDTAVCTEVLEHVEADREILAALPTGTHIVATVPNYDAFGHLRLFADADEVRRRYGVLFADLQVQAVMLTAQRTLWLMCGTRSDAALPSEDAPALPMGCIDLAATALDCVLSSDGTRYAQDFLPLFGLPFVTVADSVALAEPHVALRHDVDWSIEAAYAMALVEHHVGVRSSYYLLHPDGLVTRRNYFGQVADGRLVIDPLLFDWAARLVDLGHEVGLHNDLITLALATRRQPGEFLEQIVEAFARRGMPLAGSVAHGSPECRKLGYMNYQIFADLDRTFVAVDYRDTPELFDAFAQDQVRLEDHAVAKFTLRMADYGLRYEANYLTREIYVADSSARWTPWHGVEEPKRFEKHAPREQVEAALAGMLRAKQPGSGVQCLVHACHWSTLAHANARTLPTVRGRLRQQMGAAATRSTLQRLESFGNVIAARTDARFQTYDRDYGSKPQMYRLTSTVTQFVDRVVAQSPPGSIALLEVGCGQGDFLAAFAERLRARGNGTSVLALGVDGSPAAILTCAGRYPEFTWAADTLEHFLTAHDELVSDAQGQAQRYDIVLDKTGAIFLDGYDAACQYFARIDALMRPGALYVYVASRHYYEEVLRRKNYAGWPRDWLALAADTWEAWLADDDVGPALSGYYKRIFRKRPADGTAPDTSNSC